MKTLSHEKSGVVHINRNQWSTSTGISGPHRPESVVHINRNHWSTSTGLRTKSIPFQNPSKIQIAFERNYEILFKEKYLSQLTSQWNKKIFDGVGNFFELFERLLELEGQFFKIRNEIEVSLYRENIGFYSIEQFADELTVHALVQAGYPALSDAYALQRIFEDEAKEKKLSGLSPELCRSLLERPLPFQTVPRPNAEPRFLFVPVADWTSPYHSFCYRVFSSFLQAYIAGYPLEPRPK